MILVSVLGGLIVFSVGTPDIFAGALSVNDVQWILAESGETPAQACIRNNLNVLFAESNAIPWDQAALSTVADDILGLGISTNSSVSYGISGCCAPGMWCDSTGCFTQSFGEAFSNYGWLNGDISSVPVYACRGTATGNGSLISSAQFQTNGSLVDVLGSSNSFTFPDGIPLQGVTEMFIYSESCSNVEVCNCKDCLADPSVCPWESNAIHICFNQMSKLIVSQPARGRMTNRARVARHAAAPDPAQAAAVQCLPLSTCLH